MFRQVLEQIVGTDDGALDAEAAAIATFAAIHSALAGIKTEVLETGVQF